MQWWHILLIIIAILAVALVALVIVGQKLQKKQNAQMEQIKAAAQSVNMLIIDKKKMKIKEAGLPSIVLEQTPKAFRNAKMPIVKAKVGPKIMTLICDNRIFDSLPLKVEVKATVSGIYMTDYKSLRKINIPTEPVKKKGLFRKK